MDPKEKKQQDEQDEKEYEKGWETAGKELDAEEGLPKEEKPEAPEAEEISKPEEKPEERKPDAAAAEDPKDKALRDTKVWGTKLAQENAELKRTIQKYKEGSATQAEVDAQKKAAENAKAGLDKVREKVYTDFPELQELIDPLISGFEEMKKTIGNYESKNAEKTEADKRKAALDEYNQNVKPKVLEVHKDFEELLFTKDASGKTELNDEYFEWAKNQRPALRFAAMDSNDPEDIIEAVTEFKKFKASPEAQAHKEKITKEKSTKLANAGTLRGGSTQFPSVSSKTDKDDYDGGWNTAETQLKEQGVS